MPSNSFKVMRIRGIDIYVNWSWLLVFVFLSWSVASLYHTRYPGWSTTTDYVLGGVSALLLYVTVLLHELAHSFTARARGLPVSSITLFIFGGVSNLTREPDSPQTELLVTAAGPATSLVLGGIFYVLSQVLHSWSAEVVATLQYLAWINVVLAIFNLIPGFPLDGGRVLRAIVWLVTGSMRRATRIATRIGEGIGFLFVLAGLAEAFLAGQIGSGLWLAFIGWFLQNAAGATYQQAVLEQVLRGVSVRDVMDPPASTAPPVTSVETLVYDHFMHGNQRAVAIVNPDGSLRGLVTFTDVRKTDRDQWPHTSVIEIMTPLSELETASPDDDLREAVRKLVEHGYDQLPVLEHNKLVGMLNRGHVLQYIHVREQLGPRSDRELATKSRGTGLQTPDPQPPRSSSSA